MKTKRQPTIKTLLLLTAVMAIQCAATPAIVEINYDRGTETRTDAWWAFCGGTLFWSAIPLAIALYCRSAMRAALLGLEFGLAWVCFCLYRTKYAPWPPYEIVDKFFFGPLGYLAPMRLPHEPRPQILSYAALVLLYTCIGFLFAKSCRLRERPAVVGESDERNAKRRPCQISTWLIIESAVIALIPIIWLVYSLNWIRQRHEALSELRAMDAVVRISYADSGWDLPSSLGLLGERGLYSIRCKLGTPGKVVQKLRILFPESHVDEEPDPRYLP